MNQTKTAHTPGPWRIDAELFNNDHHDDKACSIVEGVIPPEGENPYIIAEICGDVPDHEANARLISLAPQMLEALRDLVALGEKCTQVMDDPMLDRLDRARALIQQATGGQK